ncbi:hypothetical protein HDU79_007110 [Rhizoclosmatium sp. JEL0117]|nr:hypothetical protein HDU79_007110 [Rhizoclosmatium sp. JEL0117]
MPTPHRLSSTSTTTSLSSTTPQKPYTQPLSQYTDQDNNDLDTQIFAFIASLSESAPPTTQKQSRVNSIEVDEFEAEPSQPTHGDACIHEDGSLKVVLATQPEVTVEDEEVRGKMSLKPVEKDDEGPTRYSREEYIRGDDCERVSKRGDANVLSAHQIKCLNVTKRLDSVGTSVGGSSRGSSTSEILVSSQQLRETARRIGKPAIRVRKQDYSGGDGKDVMGEARRSEDVVGPSMRRDTSGCDKPKRVDSDATTTAGASSRTSTVHSEILISTQQLRDTAERVRKSAKMMAESQNHQRVSLIREEVVCEVGRSGQACSSHQSRSVSVKSTDRTQKRKRNRDMDEWETVVPTSPIAKRTRMDLEDCILEDRPEKKRKGWVSGIMEFLHDVFQK